MKCWTYEINGEEKNLEFKSQIDAQIWADHDAFENNTHGDPIFLIELTENDNGDFIQTARIPSCAGDEFR